MATIAAIETLVVNVSPKTNWTFVAVTDGDGATGWGECSLNGWEELLVAESVRLSRETIGREAPATNALIRHLPHSPGGLVAHAVRSAVEQSLVDLEARRAGLPIASFLVPSPRRTIPAYANINRSVTERTPAGFAA